jgi:hypothetical protein
MIIARRPRLLPPSLTGTVETGPKGRAKLFNLFGNTEELRLAVAARMVRAFDLSSAEASEDQGV